MRKATDLARDRVGLDLVQRQKGDPLLETVLVAEQSRSDLLVLDDNVVQLASRTDLECCRAIKVGLVELDQVGDETLDLRSVEVGRRVRVGEICRGQT